MYQQQTRERMHLYSPVISYEKENSENCIISKRNLHRKYMMLIYGWANEKFPLRLFFGRFYEKNLNTFLFSRKIYVKFNHVLFYFHWSSYSCKNFKWQVCNNFQRKTLLFVRKLMGS